MKLVLTPLISTMAVLILIAPSPALARKKGPKKPKPSTSERKEIRKLMGRVVGGRHEARRTQAATALARFGPKAEMAVPSLVRALNDWKSNVGCAAAFALGKVGVHSKPAVNGLVKALTTGRTVDLKKAAAEGLGLIGPNAKRAIPALLKSLQSDDADLRRAAATALGYLGPKATEHAVKPLKALLDGDDQQRVRLAAAISLVRLGDTSPAMVKILAGAVQKSGKAIVEIRKAACEALGALKGKAADAVPALIEAVGEEPKINKAIPYAEQRKKQHDAFRCAAATALGEIGDARARSALEAAVDVPELRAAAEPALKKLKKS